MRYPKFHRCGAGIRGSVRIVKRPWGTTAFCQICGHTYSVKRAKKGDLSD